MVWTVSEIKHVLKSLPLYKKWRGKKINIVEASTIADKLLNEIKSHFEKIEVVGSIRRRCEDVHDIDLVAIQKENYEFGEITLEDHIKKLDHLGPTLGKELGIKRFSDGKKIKRFKFEGIMIDLYLADESTYETLKLIRTGSATHNIKLTTTAKRKGLKLYASGKGLCKIKGGMYNNEPEEILEVIATTEQDILQNLLGKYVKPVDRH